MKVRKHLAPVLAWLRPGIVVVNILDSRFEANDLDLANLAFRGLIKPAVRKGWEATELLRRAGCLVDASRIHSFLQPWEGN